MPLRRSSSTCLLGRQPQAVSCSSVSLNHHQLSIDKPVSISLYLYISSSLHLYISISLHLYISESLYLYISISLHLYISASLHLYIPISLYLFIFVFLNLHIARTSWLPGGQMAVRLRLVCLELQTRVNPNGHLTSSPRVPENEYRDPY